MLKEKAEPVSAYQGTSLPREIAAERRAPRILAVLGVTLLICAVLVAGYALGTLTMSLRTAAAQPFSPATPAPAEPPPTPAPSAPPAYTPAPTPPPSPSPSPEPSLAPTPEPTTEPAAAMLPDYLVGAGPRYQVVQQSDKVCYLTFDDGPSKHTDSLLKILQDNDVKATFFVIGANAEAYPNQLRHIDEQGHTIGNHTQTHKTDVIYQSAQALLEDAYACDATIDRIIGRSHGWPIFRFPRGSSNKDAKPYRETMEQMGYCYFDWNALNGDAETGTENRADVLYKRLVQTVEDARSKKELIVLMHDTNSKLPTQEMLPSAIAYIRSQGYRFDTLDKKLRPLPTPYPTPDLSVIPTPTPPPTPTPAPAPAPLPTPPLPVQ